MLRRHLMLLAAAAVAAVTAACGSAQPTAVHVQTIATVSSTDFRAVVGARRTGGGSAPTARVTVTTYRKAAGHWRRLVAHRLAGTYFWHTVTGPHAVCRLELATAKKPQVTVGLLLSPSLGCGRSQTIRLGS